jgi:hypothetical protein
MSEFAAPTPDAALVAAVREIETHAAEAGWDQPGRLFALVDTASLVAREPALAASLGLADPATARGLTPVEQELAGDQPLEGLLESIVWPDSVLGCAAVVERLVLPPAADDDLPQDAGEATAYAHAHPDRQEVRIVAGATRTGATYCALRMRAHDDALSVVTGSDLVPGLLELVVSTLADDAAPEMAEETAEEAVEES